MDFSPFHLIVSRRAIALACDLMRTPADPSLAWNDTSGCARPAQGQRRRASGGCAGTSARRAAAGPRRGGVPSHLRARESPCPWRSAGAGPRLASQPPARRVLPGSP